MHICVFLESCILQAGVCVCVCACVRACTRVTKISFDRVVLPHSLLAGVYV